MSDPIITPADLAVFLGSSVDEARALAIISDAQALCEAVVTMPPSVPPAAPVRPLPAGAEAVVRRVAVRAYVNPTGVTQETIGPYTVQRQATGVYLTSGDRRALRSLAGRSGAFAIDMTPAGAMSQIPPWDFSGVVAEIATS